MGNLQDNQMMIIHIKGGRYRGGIEKGWSGRGKEV